MNEKSLKILEYNKIIALLSEKAHSKSGRHLCEALKPSSDFSEVTTSLQNTDDALKRLLKSGSISFVGNKDILTSIMRLEKGSSLQASELLNICDLLECSANVKQYLKKESPDEPDDSLYFFYDLIDPLTTHAGEIRKCIISEDEISDDASAELKSIRRHINITNDKIHTELNRMVNVTYRNYLQDAVITMRDGRYCIPVKAEYKSNVPGIIHDQSGSQSTFFIEPSAIVNLNNDLKQLAIDEAREIEVILSRLSADLSEHIEQLKSDFDSLTKLDFIFAKGSLALDMNASRPLYNIYGHVNLKKARHPLLDKKTVVPINLKLGYDFDLLVITGPNTGGKTVALKTVGLLSLMGQAGLFIPASDTSELSVFDNIYADIGDEQSIEQSLSTFSSHMTNIVDILGCADENSLCLFDELGAGTDPTEGAALAVSVLSDLHKRHIRSIATTHYSELKIYALNEPGVENACCEFDVKTLRPTYRLLIGIAGKSNAFAISQKLGLPSYIIDDAKSRLSQNDETFEDVLAELENNKVIIENEKLEIEKYKQEIESLKTDYENRRKKLNESRDKIIREATEEAREILREAKDTADSVIRDMLKDEKHGDIRSMEKNRTKLREKIDKTNSNVKLKSDDKQKKKYKASDFKLGEDVKVLSLNMEGRVSSIPDSKGNLFVQCGIMRIQAKMDDIEFIDKPDIIAPGMKFSTKSNTKTTSKSLSKASDISMEINLLGRTVDEALAELDKYLDDAYLSHLPSVRIVHGKGTGALRSAVHNYLKKVSYVSSYRLAEYGEGDAGVTIAEFK